MCCYTNGGRAQLDAEDIYFDMYERAREWMEQSGMKMLPGQETQAGALHLWQLFRQASTASNGYAVANSDALCVTCTNARLDCAL